jgi:phosphoesterase RecJ-like protein
LHRVGGDMAVLADESAIYHDWPSKKPDDYAAYTYSDTSFGSTAKCYTTSFLSWKKEDKDNWNLYLYWILTDSGSFRSQELLETRIELLPIDLGVENTKIPTLLLKIVPTVDCSYWAEHFKTWK